MSFALTPLLIERLGVERFGVLTLVWVLIGYFSLFDIGIGRALTAAIAERTHTERAAEIPAVVRTSLAFLLGLGAAAGVVAAALAPWLSGSALNLPAALRPEVLWSLFLIAAGIPVVTVTTALRGILEARHRFGVVNALRIPLGILQFAGPLLVSLVTPHLGIVVGVLVLARIVACAAHLVVCVRELPEVMQPARLRPEVLWPLLRWGGWMTVSQIVGPIMVSMDRFLIGSWLNARAVAFYATPNDVVARSSFLPESLVRVLFPAFAARTATSTLLFDRACRVLLMVIGFVMAPVVAFAPEALNWWLGPEFAARSAPVLRWLSYGVLFNSLARVPFALIQGRGRPDLTARFHLSQLFPYLLLLVVLLKAKGIVGVAIAWTLRAAADALLLFWVSPRFIEWPVPARVRFAVATFLMIGGSAIVVLPQAAATRSVYLMLFFALAGVLSWSHLLMPAERAGVIDLFRRSCDRRSA